MAHGDEDGEPEHPQDGGEPHSRVGVSQLAAQPSPGEHERHPHDQVNDDCGYHAADYDPRRAAAVGGGALWTFVPIALTVHVVAKRDLYLVALFIEVACWANGAKAGLIATGILAVIYWL